MTVGILTEKASAAKKFAAALGGMTGSFDGQDYVITHARGHLYEFASPHEMVADRDLSERYRRWELENLPWDPQDFDWSLAPIEGTADRRKAVRDALSPCDEIVIATDVDPTGEGGMIAVNALLELGLRPRRLSRMYFTDEAESSLRDGFSARVAIPSLTDLDEYRKALYRSQFDLLSMQFTRIATNQARESGKDLVLRQGRLKSAMVKLVGDQLKAHEDYVRKPFFENRFRDENGVMYIDPEQERYDREDQVPRGDLASSPVVLDSRTEKKSPPPKLLDLATLSSMLVSQGVKAKVTLKTYQKMYEAQVVSYPRTEDKTITPEQFKELLPHVDTIAGVVGVDVGRLSHRQPRKTHVKPEGAHGANRPGLKVPSSLDALEEQYGVAGRLIYQTLAKNYLAMLAEDYHYEQQKGHVEKHPGFVGKANVPLSPGWKVVFDPDAGDDDAEGDQDESSLGLGKNADPFVFEGANKRPEHPSMRWLMKQLAKRDVGTGATRTSTYTEVTNSSAKYPLLTEKGKKVTLAESGQMSWLLLPGTHIGDLSLTERIYADMREIAEGSGNAQACLSRVAGQVREDIETMRANAETMRAELGLSKKSVQRAPRASGIWQSAPGGAKEVSFKRVFSGYEFTDEEVQALLAGQSVTITATSARTGKEFTATGALGVSTYQGRKYVGFQIEVEDKPTSWCKHVFTPTEVEALLAGRSLEITDFVGKSGKPFGARVSWDAKKKKIVPDFGIDTPPLTWAQHTFTPEEKKALTDGEEIVVTGVSKKGSTFEARISWTEENGKKKIVPHAFA